MTRFDRSFAAAALAEWDAAHPQNAVRELFARWCLPGAPTSEKTRLRIGIRNSYLNFYVKGQSIAKLSVTREGPKVSVHHAYVEGRRRVRGRDGTPQSQGYRSYSHADLTNPETAALLEGWVEVAETYASAEKRFVDDLVAANPGVIDLEMGLPASAGLVGKPVAPRMDLVVAQSTASESISIAFWEAKCANNSELRARVNKPRVLDQVEKYVKWISEGDHLPQVQRAYSNAAQILLELQRHFRSGDETAECVAIWRSLSQLKAPPITVRPGVVIGNYWPAGYIEEIASGRIAQAASSFGPNGHRDVLQAEGVRVHEVGPGYGDPALPVLQAS